MLQFFLDFLWRKKIGFKMIKNWLNLMLLRRRLIIFKDFDLRWPFSLNFYIFFYWYILLNDIIVCTCWASTDFFDMFWCNLIVLMFLFLLFHIDRKVFLASFWTFLLFHDPNLSIFALSCNWLGKNRFCFTFTFWLFLNFRASWRTFLESFQMLVDLCFFLRFQMK